MIELTKELIKQYYDAYYSASLSGNYKQLNDFKALHPKECSLLASMHNKRSILNKDIEALDYVARKHQKRVYFGALTFNDNHIFDKNKRRDVFAHLNECFIAFFVVEESGALNGRYHVHFVGIFRDGVDMSDFHSWCTEKGEGYSEIKPIYSARKVTQYLCDYLVKQVPRIHRNKTMCFIRKQYCSALSFKSHFPSIYENKLIELLSSVAFLSSYPS